jgi:hypothetical protein
MTDLTFLTPEPDPTAIEKPPRKCRHPRDRRVPIFVGPPPTKQYGWLCQSCGHAGSGLSVRRGKSARRLGGDQERRIERVYGPTKIGERGDPVDHLGRQWKWQSKATRAEVPKWLARITEPTPHDVPAAIANAWNAMAGLYGDRAPVVIRSYVRQGAKTRDWLFIDAHDGVREFGYDTLPYVTGWWVIPGDWWLDHFGRDEQEGADR